PPPLAVRSSAANADKPKDHDGNERRPCNPDRKIRAIDQKIHHHDRERNNCRHRNRQRPTLPRDRRGAVTVAFRSEPIRGHGNYPTLPSREIEISFCASTANSIGSCCSTSLTKPLTTSAVASSADMPRWRQ